YGREEARRKKREILGRLRGLPDGERKASEAGRMIERLSTFIGYREYPKFGMVSRYFVYRQALLGEAERLHQAGVLGARDDIFYLTFAELDEVVRAGRSDGDLIRRRRDEFRSHQALSPRRVLTSEGEVVEGRY